jgi:DNA excision repair protein ERCC-6
MGLGKTISAISLIATLYTTHWMQVAEGSGREKLKAFLVVCPATCISQWVSELKLWTQSLSQQIPILTFQDSGGSTKATLEQAFKQSGVLVTSYEFVRGEAERFQDKGRWHYVILDEAQKIKNSESLVHKAVMGLNAEHRLILSGTPMQNSLQELWSLFNFVQPGLLGQLDFFEHQFCKTIIKGGYTRASEVEKETAKQCLQELRELIQGHILRRTKKQVKIECDLPERNEYIVFCNLTQAQLTLYENYLRECREFLDSDYNRPEALGILNNLRKICNHPFMYFAYHDSDKGTGFKFRKLNVNPTYHLYRETRL